VTFRTCGNAGVATFPTSSRKESAVSDFLDKFRRHEGDDQLDFWPERQTPWSKKIIIGTLAVVALIALMASSYAQVPVIVSSGVICDEAEEVKALVTTGDAPQGCGALLAEVGAILEVVEQFEHERLVFTIGRFYIPLEDGLFVQYGLIGEPTPAPLEA
jgi:hypothetical protein